MEESLVRFSVMLGVVLACALPGSALAGTPGVLMTDPLDQPCYPHSFCTPDIVGASATDDPAAGTVTVTVTFARPVPAQEDPGVPGFEVKVALARSATNGHCGNIASVDIMSGLSQGDVLLRGFVAGQVANPQWAQGDLAIGGVPRRLEVTRVLSADGMTLEYGFQNAALAAGTPFWCFEVTANPVSKEATVEDTAPYVTFAGVQPAPGLSQVLAGRVTAGGAYVAATIDSDGSPASAHVEFGATAKYGQRTSESAPADAVAPFSAALIGLRAGTTYHFRVVATNATGTSATPDQTFTTRGSGTRALVVAGSLVRGSLARCTPGAGGGGTKLSGVRWLRGAHPIPGATSATYRIRAPDRGTAIRCTAKLVASDGGSAQVTSAARHVAF
jgi:hypothetical protein